MAVAFWISVFLIVYPNVLYPASIILLSSLFKARETANRVPSHGPVAVICAAHNEEKVIAEKIENFYAQDYPDRELFIGLDACSDRTADEIRRVTRDKRVKVFDYPRQGKARVIESLIREAWQPYLVLTDANSIFRADAISRLMDQMDDNGGVVCGRLILKGPGRESGEALYWRLETRLKRAESRWGSVMGANGAIYLIRRSLFDPLPKNVINDDLVISLRIYQKGFPIVFADDAIAEEESEGINSVEIKRHIRDSAGHVYAARFLTSLLNPLKPKRFFFYVSHRILRWLGPVFLLFALFSNFALIGRPFYALLAVLQILAYGSAILVHFFGIRWRPAYVLGHFLILNAIMLVGYFRAFAGLQKPTWEPTPR